MTTLRGLFVGITALLLTTLPCYAQTPSIESFNLKDVSTAYIPGTNTIRFFIPTQSSAAPVVTVNYYAGAGFPQSVYAIPKTFSGLQGVLVQITFSASPNAHAGLIFTLQQADQHEGTVPIPASSCELMGPPC